MLGPGVVSTIMLSPSNPRLAALFVPFRAHATKHVPLTKP
jgi:hypothetical protein